MQQKVIMAIDQGTTGTRVILFDHEGNATATAYREIAQIYPQPGWVEHDPKEYWQTVLECAREVMEKGRIKATEIAAIGITNQRETTILWDKDSGRPLYNAIVWQCRRTASMCEELKAKGLEPLVREKTGLVIDAYFSATKIRWILDNVREAKEKLVQGKICMGNIDSWLIWQLSGGKAHVTDYSNASRTMLLNIHTLRWDEELLEALGIELEILPELMPSSGIMAKTSKEAFFGVEVPVAGVAGDQHAATFGQTCFKPGMAKNTYGTALALMMNIGETPKLSQNGLTTNLGWHIAGKTEYALEGVVFIGGAAVQWLRDGIGIVDSAQDCNELARTVADTGGVYMVPAFAGLGAPHWDQHARGAVFGITRGTTSAHIARASLESIAFQTKDVLDAMADDAGIPITELRVDGGASINDGLMEFQAGLTQVKVVRPKALETTAMGAAFFAGLAVGFWENLDEIRHIWKKDAEFESHMSSDEREQLLKNWHKAVDRVRGWDK